MNDQVTLQKLWDSFKKSLIKNKGYWQITLIFIVLLVGVLSVIFCNLPTPCKKYWYEDNGHFPWVGVSVFIAAIGFLGNQIWERKKLNADIKSKSRIEWMVTVRNLLANFLADAEDIYSEVHSMGNVTLNETNSEHSEEIIKKYNVNVKALLVEYYELCLYIPITEDNKKLNQGIHDIWDIVDQKNREVVRLGNAYRGSEGEDKERIGTELKRALSEMNDSNVHELILKIESLSDIGRDYFKEEWERAKQGE